MNTTIPQKQERCAAWHTVLTLYREMEEHRLLYTLRSRSASKKDAPATESTHDASRSFTLTVAHLCEGLVRERSLEDFSEDAVEAAAFTRLMAAELVFPEHLHDVWEDLKEERSERRSHLAEEIASRS